MVYIAVFYIIALGLAALVMVFWIDRNWFKRYMKEANGRVQLAEVKRWEAIYLQRPTVYELWIELEENGEKRERLLRSSSPFFKRYQREKSIRVVTIPGTDLVFAEEENWQEQNASAGIMIAVAFALELLMIAMAEAVPFKTAGVCIVVLYFGVLLFALRRRTKLRACGGHRTRMKYLTDLQCDAVIEMLGQETDGAFSLKKETQNVKDKCYLLSMRGRTYEKARYRVIVTPTQNGSAVWVYLLACGNPYALNRYAKQLERFLQGRIGAVRV